MGLTWFLKKDLKLSIEFGVARVELCNGFGRRFDGCSRLLDVVVDGRCFLLLLFHSENFLSFPMDVAMQVDCLMRPFERTASDGLRSSQLIVREVREC
ncbi:hypothetical protein QR680_018531 [Steinernema hermaphroditum]|uniref:Uncharacterized protein n=1 Tax=Steinernema hermaphroditum TaxID=289476 RepID=A0AA39HJ33_9BILA|nr:hypothetical protein QR680_018531 [Steinernema hermaphroditum]